MVIDQAEKEVEQLQGEGRLYVHGNAEDKETLAKAGIDRAFGLILALPEDSSNVFVTLTAREMNPNVFILARTIDHRNQSKLLQTCSNAHGLRTSHPLQKRVYIAPQASARGKLMRQS